MANINGTAAAEILDGTGAEDLINGFGGDDRINAAQGSDAAFGGDGDDILKGGAGTDALFGDAGRDTLVGGKSDDSLSGGFGADKFVFRGAFGDDAVLDFQDGTDLLRIVAPGVDDIGDLTFEAIEVFGVVVGTTITLASVGASDSITLAGVAPDRFDAGDFLFG